ncbi:MAG: AI-2E family transporter [Alphaproteobacteria bacterium]|nr:MAG: AI-2E family transporter [Alphaproteobacteria bacterium]
MSMTVFGRWVRRVLDDPQVLLLLLLLAGTFGLLNFFARPLAPVIAAVVLAFLLDRPTELLRRRGWPNWAASTVVFTGFLALVVLGALVILPPVVKQFEQFLALVPDMVARLRSAALGLPDSFPGLVSPEFVQDFFEGIGRALTSGGQALLDTVLSSVRGAVTLAVYLILILLMLFFFIKDKRAILGWLASFLPQERPLLDAVYCEVVEGAGNYARGKFYEILIVGVAAWLTYLLLDLRFAVLLALITGLSVVIPYVGATVVTFPVAMVAFFQWGIGPEFFAVLIAYLILQAIDGNLLAPLLMSEVVRLHPNAVILSILIFGHLWGVWGVFFAIPLAVLIHAVIEAWRCHNDPACDMATAVDGAPD